MIIKVIHSDDYDESDIQHIKKLLLDNPDPTGNYDVNDWENKPHTLLYVFLKTERFNKDQGGLVLLYDNNTLLGVSGYNVSHFNSEVYILGARTLIDKNHRHKLLMSNYFIPIQIDLVKDQAKMVVFLFDQHNKFNLYDIFVSGKLNLFLKNKFDEFAHIWHNLKHVEFPIRIFPNTLHNVLYIKIDENFMFDWEKLRVQDV